MRGRATRTCKISVVGGRVGVFFVCIVTESFNLWRLGPFVSVVWCCWWWWRDLSLLSCVDGTYHMRPCADGRALYCSFFHVSRLPTARIAGLIFFVLEWLFYGRVSACVRRGGVGVLLNCFKGVRANRWPASSLCQPSVDVFFLEGRGKRRSLVVSSFWGFFLHCPLVSDGIEMIASRGKLSRITFFTILDCRRVEPFLP